MRDRGVRVGVLMATVLAVSSGVASAAGSHHAPALKVAHISGLSQTLLGATPVVFTVQVHARGPRRRTVTLAAWLVPLAGHQQAVPLLVSRVSPAAVTGAKTVQLTTQVPPRVKAGRYRLLVCAGRRGRKPPSTGCVKSSALSLIVPIPIVIGKNPITVSPSLATASASSATIGSDGGTLTATAPDGSKLTLTIPANALAGDEQVTLTPLSALSGSPVPMVAAAQIDPAGLDLLQAATLAITPAHGVPVAQQVAFGYQTPGSEFGLVPLALQPSVVIPINVFGGFGLGQADASQLGAIKARPPSDPFSALEQQLALGEYQLRQQKLLHGAAADAGDPPASLENLPAELAGYYDSYVQPALAVAASSPAALANAGQVAFGWEHEVALLGLEGAFSSQFDEVRASFFSALKTVWDQTIAKCNGGLDTIPTLHTAISLARAAELLGAADLLGGEEAINTELFQKCAQLNLQISLAMSNTTSSVPSNIAPEAAYSSLQVVAATVPAKLQLQSYDETSDTYTLTTPNVPVNESIPTFTIGSTWQNTPCTITPPVVTDGVGITYMSFTAQLSVPPDFFSYDPKPATIKISTGGADAYTGTLTCPSSPNPIVEQLNGSPNAMHMISYLTQQTPVVLTEVNPSGSFSGSFTNPGGVPLGTLTTSGTITLQTQ